MVRAAAPGRSAVVYLHLSRRSDVGVSQVAHSASAVALGAAHRCSRRRPVGSDV